MVLIEVRISNVPLVIDCSKEHLRSLRDLKDFLRKRNHLCVQYGDTNQFSCDVAEDYLFFDTLGVPLDEKTSLERDFLATLPPPPPEQQQPLGNGVSAAIICNFSPTSVHVRHLGTTVTIASVPPHAPLGFIKTSLARQAPEAVRHNPLTNVELSYRGARCSDNQPLAKAQTNKAQDDDDIATLNGQLRLKVTDDNCSTSCYVLVSEYDSVRNIMRRFAQGSKRVVYSGSKLKIEDDEKNADATVYDLQLDHDDEVQFENPEFVVAVREDNAALARSPEERDIGVHVTVSDHTEVAELRRLIGEISQRPLTANDRIYLEEDGSALAVPDMEIDQTKLTGFDVPTRPRGPPRELSDDHLLFVYGIRHGSRLKIVRERPAPEFEYQCAKCGNDVMLKRNDLVRCRHCGYRILFKKRTTKFAHIFKCE